MRDLVADIETPGVVSFELTPEDVEAILLIDKAMYYWIKPEEGPGYIPRYDWNKMVADKFNEWKKDEIRNKTKDGRL